MDRDTLVKLFRKSSVTHIPRERVGSVSKFITDLNYRIYNEPFNVQKYHLIFEQLTRTHDLTDCRSVLLRPFRKMLIAKVSNFNELESVRQYLSLLLSQSAGTHVEVVYVPKEIASIMAAKDIESEIQALLNIKKALGVSVSDIEYKREIDLRIRYLGGVFGGTVGEGSDHDLVYFYYKEFGFGFWDVLTSNKANVNTPNREIECIGNQQVRGDSSNQSIYHACIPASNAASKYESVRVTAEHSLNLLANISSTDYKAYALTFYSYGYMDIKRMVDIYKLRTVADNLACEKARSADVKSEIMDTVYGGDNADASDN